MASDVPQLSWPSNPPPLVFPWWLLKSRGSASQLSRFIRGKGYVLSIPGSLIDLGLEKGFLPRVGSEGVGSCKGGGCDRSRGVCEVSS